MSSGGKSVIGCEEVIDSGAVFNQDCIVFGREGIQWLCRKAERLVDGRNLLLLGLLLFA